MLISEQFEFLKSNLRFLRYSDTVIRYSTVTFQLKILLGWNAPNTVLLGARGAPCREPKGLPAHRRC